MSSSNSTNAFLKSQFLDVLIGSNPSTERARHTHINVHPRLPLLIYPSGRFIIVRNYEDPSESFVYRAHTAPTTVAKFSTNGNWVASADSAGKVRVWAWDNPEHLTKFETTLFSGAISDLDWCPESKKIVATGDGSGILVKCFEWDSGSVYGEMQGHNKRVLSASYKPNRPYRIVTGGEDMRACFYQGPPFALLQSNSQHTNIINCVRYAPNGEYAVIVSSDKKIQVLDGKTGDVLGSIPNAHDGGIYSVAVSPDSTQFVSASADKTIKIWDRETLKLVKTLRTVEAKEAQLADMQLGVVWNKDYIFALALNGDLSLFDPATGELVRTMIGHHDLLLSVCVDRDSAGTGEGARIFTSSADGVVLTSTAAGKFADAKRFRGTDKRNISSAAHSSKAVGMIRIGADTLVSVGWDDKARFASISGLAYQSEIALNGQPIAIAKGSDVSSELFAILTHNELVVYRGQNRVASLDLSRENGTFSALSVFGETEVAVGVDNKVRIYQIAGSTLQQVHEIVVNSTVSVLSYNEISNKLAVGESNRVINVYERDSWKSLVPGLWVFHTTRITALAWSPCGRFLASGSNDDAIYIWSTEKPSSKFHVPLAHMGGITGLAWTTNEQLVSVGNDQCVVSWNFPVETLV